MLDIIYIYVLNLFEDIYIFKKKLYNLIEIKNKNYIILYYNRYIKTKFERVNICLVVSNLFLK